MQQVYNSKVKPFSINIDTSRDELLTKYGVETLKDRYMLPEEVSPQENFARAACAYADDAAHAQRLYDYASQLWFGFSTPILCNAATDRGLPISCFLNYVEDSCEGLADNYSEDIFLSRYGGGIGTYMGSVRSLGEMTSKGNKTTGLIPFMKVKDSLSLAFQQGANRRGSCAVYIDVSHPEIEEFIEIRRPTRAEDRRTMALHHAVNITDTFMQAVSSDDDWLLIDPNSKNVKKKVRARELFASIIKARMETGEPYIHFIDTSNREMPQALKVRGLKINTSNLCCVVGSERVVTSEGLLTAEELYKRGAPLSVFDGTKSVSATKMHKIKKNENVFKVTLRNGQTHTITKEHKVLTTQGLKECSSLKVGDKVVIQNRKGLFGKTHAPEKAFLLGLYQADGTQHKNNRFIDVWENDFDILSEIEHCVDVLYQQNGFNEYEVSVPNRGLYKRGRKSPKFTNCVVNQSLVKKKRLSSNKLEKLGFEKGVIPQWIWEGDEETQWQYVRGLFIADGTAAFNEKAGAFNLAITNINKKFLKDLQLLLRNLGVNFSLGLMHKERRVELPDGKGGVKEYFCKEAYRLTCGDRESGLIFEENTVFLTRKNVCLEPALFKGSLGYSPIVSIEHVGREDVYCVQVFTDEHLWTVNGIITHNSEIYLPTAPDRTAVCCLSSLNLEKYLEWKDNHLIVEDLVRMLDNVLQSFIDNAHPQMWRAANSARKERSLGLGVMGFHAFLQSLNLPFESITAATWNQKMFAQIYHQAKAASSKLAEERGEAPDMKGTGYRNAHLIAIAPTASNSNICGETSPSIEPFSANGFNKKTLNGTKTFKNKYLEKILESMGKNTDEIWHSIITNEGSVQHLTFLDQAVKDVFKTSFELDMDWVVEHAIIRQKFIDQGQSLNLFFYPDTPFGKLYSVHKKAWQGGLKGLYYLRSFSKKRAENGGLELYKENVKPETEYKEKTEEQSCLMCEG